MRASHHALAATILLRLERNGTLELELLVDLSNTSSSSIGQVSHGIKLYPPGTPVNTLPTNTDKPVVAESYDEVVFTDPTEAFFRTLQAVREVPTVKELYSQHEHFGVFSDADDVHALLEAQKFLREQLRTARERLKAVTDGALKLEEEVVKQIEKQKQQQQQQQRRGSAAASLPPGAKKDSSGGSSSAKASAANRNRPAAAGAPQKAGSNKKLKQTK